MPPITSVSETEEISTHHDPVIRNLKITQCYAELSQAMVTRTGIQANWCTFATWASKQAGQTIRKEDLEAALDDLLAGAAAVAAASPAASSAPQQAGAFSDLMGLFKAVWQVVSPAAAFERASQAVARGNLKVFTEIGREFARFYADLLDDQVYDANRIVQFCSLLRLGPPPEGQEYLRRAFERYYQAFFETDGRTRLQLLLLANIEIGFHEQTRLQTEILAALNAGVIKPRLLGRTVAAAVLKGPERKSSLKLLFMLVSGKLKPFQPVIGEFLEEIRIQVRRLITDHMMTLALPGSLKLHLGEDLPAAYPPELRQIDLPDLRELLARIDPTPDSTLDTGAVDWGDLAERLHFIADMFRAYALSNELFDLPFSPEQAAAIKNGNLPGGKL